MSNRSGGPGPPLFSVFCFSKRPPARHPEVARPPTDPEIKKRRPSLRSGHPRANAPHYGVVRADAVGYRAAIIPSIADDLSAENPLFRLNTPIPRVRVTV